MKIKSVARDSPKPPPTPPRALAVGRDYRGPPHLAPPPLPAPPLAPDGPVLSYPPALCQPGRRRGPQEPATAARRPQLCAARPDRTSRPHRLPAGLPRGCRPRVPSTPGYSVRVENAVPMVTQAPRGPALQIQSGLLARRPGPAAPSRSSCPGLAAAGPHLVQHATVIPDAMTSAQPLANWRSSHPHGNHYSSIMQQPALLAGHVTLPSGQPLNVGVAHVMRQQPSGSSSSKKSKQHQGSNRRSLAAALQTGEGEHAAPLRRGPPAAPGPPAAACGPRPAGGWDGSTGTAAAAARPRHTIVIPDTPSPAVSVITISSDTDEEDDRRRASASAASKQRKDVVSCVTVHDSPASDSSRRRQRREPPRPGSPAPPTPPASGPRAPGRAGRRRADPRHRCPAPQGPVRRGSGRMRAAAAGHCDPPELRLQVQNYQRDAVGQRPPLRGGAYRQQRSGPHPFQQQQPLNLSQVCAAAHGVRRRRRHRRQQAYIAPTMAAQAPYSFHHGSPSHTAAAGGGGSGGGGGRAPAPGLSGPPAGPGPPVRLRRRAALGSAGAVAHLVTSQGAARHAYPPGVVHQVPVGVAHRVLSSPALHPAQYQAQFAHQTYISASRPTPDTS
ncbi:hypothetical protein ANANG_G00309480 [Anguilla anguilla]|uniref:Uncharacterized protein n=1 Tax=Anguilla anguilla TaxID=7936 RepID=A0A9D3LH11_ANGAN|nr:hypothetical protein ANANG_G00309480 [Anguilla anguilla]